MASNGRYEKRETSKAKDEAQKYLTYINTYWEIRNNSYFISSHRLGFGKALIKGRELLHNEVRRYVDPMISKQNEFNRSVVEVLNEITRTTKRQSMEVEEQSLDIKRLASKIEKPVRDIIAAMNEDIENRARLAEILDKRIAQSMQAPNDSSKDKENIVNYFAFEERFRGTRADIKGRQSAFLQYFKRCKNVLDIGCGRGEFLELIRDHGTRGHGIDVDEDMVSFCRAEGLDVDKVDAVTFLNKYEEINLDGIFIDQVVEHVEPEYLMKMLDLCYKKLIYGGIIVVETVNPLSFFSFANFYIDMSHKRPVHPETLRFLLSVVGFKELELKLIAPVPDEARLKKIGRDVMSEGNNEAIAIYNYNIDTLNSVIFGPQDYAIIGKKCPSDEGDLI